MSKPRLTPAQKILRLRVELLLAAETFRVYERRHLGKRKCAGFTGPRGVPNRYLCTRCLRTLPAHEGDDIASMKAEANAALAKRFEQALEDTV
jgi:hypothetical protein